MLIIHCTDASFAQRVTRHLSCIFFAVLLLGFSSSSQAKDDLNLSIKPFKSDGCSAFPDGTFSQNELWLKCCWAHDFAYWKGGSYTERKQADEELQSCVQSLGETQVAYLMLAGVRVGGTPFLPTGFRWGYGWSFPRLYGDLSEQEKTAIESQLELNPVNLSLPPLKNETPRVDVN